MVPNHSLRLFTWMYSDGVAAPQCPVHSNESVCFSRNDGNLVVICKGAGNLSHLLNICSQEQFDAEKQEAAAFFERDATKVARPACADSLRDKSARKPGAPRHPVSVKTRLNMLMPAETRC